MAPTAEDIEDEIKNEKNPPPLDEDDIALLKTYVRPEENFHLIIACLSLSFFCRA